MTELAEGCCNYYRYAPYVQQVDKNMNMLKRELEDIKMISLNMQKWKNTVAGKITIRQGSHNS